MKEEKDLLQHLPRRDGMTVPDGYFADFAARMAASLPPTAFETGIDESVKRPRTLWQRVRPYVYMAAMFAGVWCMLKMFTMISTPTDAAMQPSPVLAEALGNEIFVNDYVLNNVDEYDLYDEMMDDGIDVFTISQSMDESMDNSNNVILL